MANINPKHIWITSLPEPLQTSSQGSLQGLRFAVKDNIDVAGVPTTAGCEAFAYYPQASASSVSKLLAAGASLVGKTNLDQFACGLNGTRSPYGACENSFDTRYISGGSSSGSAVAVATGQVDFALGTDTAGSGRVPASLNNIIGLKPTKGLISCAGVVAASQSVDCISIFARDIPTAIAVLNVASGFDELDPYSRKISLNTAPIAKTFSFAVPNTLEFFGDEAAQTLFTKAVERMLALGGSCIQFDYEPLATAAKSLYESAYVAERYQSIREFFDANEEQVLPSVRSIIASGKGYGAADLFEVFSALASAKQKADVLLAKVDFLLLPTCPTTYTIEQMQADPIALNRNLGYYTNFVNLLDMAAIAIPAGIKESGPQIGLPWGISLIGASGSDLQLAQRAQQFLLDQDLGCGASELLRLNKPKSIDLLSLWHQSAANTTRVAVVGAHLSGMPLNTQLTERGARLLQSTSTSPRYQFFALPNTTPPKPGLKFVGDGGSAIALEIWEMPMENYGSFVSLIPSPLGIGTVELIDGSSVQGFICEPRALEGAKDISSFGGWRAYIASLNKTPTQ